MEVYPFTLNHNWTLQYSNMCSGIWPIALMVTAKPHADQLAGETVANSECCDQTARINKLD